MAVLLLASQTAPDSDECAKLKQSYPNLDCSGAVVVANPSPEPSPSPSPSPSAKPKKASKPRLELKCRPRMQIGRPDGGAVMVIAVPRVQDPGENLWCPGIQWTINGENAGFHESDCRPWNQVPEGERKVWPESETAEAKIFYFSEGQYVIGINLMKSGNLLAQETCTVQVN